MPCATLQNCEYFYSQGKKFNQGEEGGWGRAPAQHMQGPGSAPDCKKTEKISKKKKSTFIIIPKTFKKKGSMGSFKLGRRMRPRLLGPMGHSRASVTALRGSDALTSSCLCCKVTTGSNCVGATCPD